jgi:hypothetical protein
MLVDSSVVRSWCCAKTWAALILCVPITFGIVGLSLTTDLKSHIATYCLVQTITCGVILLFVLAADVLPTNSNYRNADLPRGVPLVFWLLVGQWIMMAIWGSYLWSRQGPPTGSQQSNALWLTISFNIFACMSWGISALVGALLVYQFCLCFYLCFCGPDRCCCLCCLRKQSVAIVA